MRGIEDEDENEDEHDPPKKIEAEEEAEAEEEWDTAHIIGRFWIWSFVIGTSTLRLSKVFPRAMVSGMTGTKVTPESIRAMKTGGEKIAALTAYDFPMTRLLDEVGIPLILVGDSLGMVVLGYPDTTHVTMAEMEHHVRAAARARPRALLVADLPYHSYETVESAVANAQRLRKAGAEAVKAEGGKAILPQVEGLVTAGIPFMGHLGMLPQHVLEEGGYHIKGKAEQEYQQLLADAEALEQAGAFAVVLELVTARLAREISERISIPTIGIGAGPDCDGQILVTPDLLGMLPWYSLKHVKARLNAAEQMRAVVREWKESVQGKEVEAVKR